MKFVSLFLFICCSLGAVETISSTAEGFVESVFVKKGDAVKKNELLVELIQPTQVLEMVSLQAEIKALLVDLSELKQEIREGEGQYLEEQSQKKEILQQKIDSLNEALSRYEEDLKRNEKLLKDGLISEEVLEDAATQVEKTKTEIENSLIQLEEMDGYRSSEFEELQQEIAEKQQELKAYKKEQNMLKISSPIDGMVKEVFVGVGDRVYEGTPLLTIY